MGVSIWRAMGNLWEIYGKFMGNHRKSMESHGKIHAKSIRNPWESYAKSMEETKSVDTAPSYISSGQFLINP